MLCALEYCDRPRYGRKPLCQTHHTYESLGKPLGPIRDRAPRRETHTRRTRAEVLERREGKKRCKSCRAWLPPSAYGRAVATADGLTADCRRCARVRRHNGDPKKHAGERCEVCGSREALVVDHDHACCSGPASCGECIRGTLCKACNVGIGFLRDDASLLLRAARYLLSAIR